jgi:CRP-like cAMP-binding protein
MSIEQLVEATASLNASDAFRPRFDAKRWAQFGSYLQQHKLRAGDMLVRFHDQDRNMYLLESGNLQVYVPDTAALRPSGGRWPSCARARWWASPACSATPRMAQVEAMSPAVWVLTRPRFEELLVRVPDLGIELLRAIGAVMAERMRANLERGQPIV